jgi:thiol:disulfide interchange protein DsbD
VYPVPKTRKDPYLGELSEFDGRIVIRVPGEIDASREAAPIKLAGALVYQACDDQGHCFPPDAISFALTVGLGRRSEGGVHVDWLAASTAEMTQGTPPPALAATSVDQTEPPSPTPANSLVGMTGVPTSFGGTSSSSAGRLPGFLGRFGLGGLLVGCFLYGLFINATPCVLPLLSIKVLGFVQQAHEARRRTLVLGLTFGGGVMVFFVVLGLLAAAGTNILQFPEAVIGLGTVVMAMGLSMLGVFTLQPPNAALSLEANIKKEGALSSFGKGALAPVLGFACTGPLLAGAFGWATQQPPLVAVVAFLFAGLGMAFPYMVLGANPHWLSFLPRPGQWMVVFERIMGFLLLAMVIWLLHPLVTQIGSEGLEWTLVFLVFVGLACWVFGQVRFDMSAMRRWAYRGGAIAVVVFAGGIIYEGVFPLDEAVAAAQAVREAVANCENGESAHKVHFRSWSAQAVEETVRSGKPAFVDFTAAYCTVCKVNKAVAINTPEVHDKMKALDIVAFQGDFTTDDPEVFAALQKHGRWGVPLNLIYPAGRPDAPLVLETQLTKQYLLQKLDDANRMRPASIATGGG